MPVTSAGAIGDGFDRQRLLVTAVEGELPSRPHSGTQSIRAQRDAADPGSLQTEGFVQRVRSAGQEDGVLGGFGQGPAAAGGTQIGVADRAGHARGDLAGGAEAGTEVVGEGEQDAPVGGRVEFVPGEAMFRAQAAGAGVESTTVVSRPRACS